MNTELIKRQVNILHLEDDEFDHYAVAEMVRNAGIDSKISIVKSQAEFVGALQGDEYDLILSDFTLPDYDGFSALSTARKLRPETPFVFFSGTIAEEQAVDSLKNGAADYVSKRSPDRLVPAIRSALRNAKARSRLKPLQQNDERLRLVARTANDVTWDWDLKSNKIRLSENFQTVFGHRLMKLEIMPGEWFDFIHPDDKKRVMSGISALISSGEQVWRSEHRFRRADRSYASIFDRASVINDSDGKPARMVGVSIDMTECRQAERKLAEECRLLRTLIDLIPNFIFVKDRTSRIVLANSATVNLLGANSPDEIADKSETSFFEPPIAQALRQKNDEVLSSGNSLLNYEEKIIMLDGKTCWLSTSKVPWRDQDGNVIGLVGISRDITEQKLAQEQISQQTALLDAAQDAILVQDVEGSIQYWNKSAARIHGWAADEVIGRNAGEILHKSPAAFRKALKDTLEQGQWNGELTRMTKSHGEVIMQSRWTLIRDAKGHARSILDISTDITDKRQIEEKFLRVQRMENIGKLASGITHDLNNILAPILMCATLLKQKVQDEGMLKILTLLEVNTQRAAAVVKQVLGFGRSLEGQRSLFNPQGIVEEVLQIISETFSKSIHIEANINPDAWNVIGSPTQLHQVLLNLCINARDAMPTGGKLTITVRNLTMKVKRTAATPEAKPGTYVVLEVSDTGCGIPDEIRGRIFEPFFTTKSPDRGTGLGLYTSLLIVKSWGGFIQMESQVGQGSIFRVYLPAYPALSDGQSGSQAKDFLRGNNETVLVVDDEESVRETTREILESFGYRVLLAPEGAKALDLYIQNQDSIAAVVTDVMMPVMNGVDFVRALRHRNPQVEIIVVTGLDSGVNRATIEELGVRHFLAKPFAVETILGMLHEVLADSCA